MASEVAAGLGNQARLRLSVRRSARPASAARPATGVLWAFQPCMRSAGRWNTLRAAFNGRRRSRSSRACRAAVGVRNCSSRCAKTLDSSARESIRITVLHHGSRDSELPTDRHDPGGEGHVSDPVRLANRLAGTGRPMPVDLDEQPLRSVLARFADRCDRDVALRSEREKGVRFLNSGHPGRREARLLRAVAAPQRT